MRDWRVSVRAIGAAGRAPAGGDAEPSVAAASAAADRDSSASAGTALVSLVSGTPEKVVRFLLAVSARSPTLARAFAASADAAVDFSSTRTTSPSNTRTPGAAATTAFRYAALDAAERRRRRSVEGQLFQRGDVPQRGESARVSDGIVREETSFQSPRERARGEVFDVIASEVELGETLEGSQVSGEGDVVPGEVEYTEGREALESAGGLHAVVVQVEDVESREVGQTRDAAHAVSAEHEDAETRGGFESADGLHRVCVEVEEDEVADGLEGGEMRVMALCW